MTIKRRSRVRAGRLRGYALTQLRDDCWERDKGICQAVLRDGNISFQCSTQTFKELPHTAPNSYHMSHKQAKRRGGDSLDNVEVFCGDCHRRFHNYGPSMTKPCPKRVQIATA